MPKGRRNKSNRQTLESQLLQQMIRDSRFWHAHHKAIACVDFTIDAINIMHTTPYGGIEHHIFTPSETCEHHAHEWLKPNEAEAIQTCLFGLCLLGVLPDGAIRSQLRRTATPRSARNFL